MSKKINKIFGTICSGILFGSFAGLMIVVILYLFPADASKSEVHPEDPVAIEQAEPIADVGNKQDESRAEETQTRRFLK